MRWIMRLLGGVVVLCLLLAGALFLLPGDRIARIAAAQVEARTGRALTLSGETRVSYYPVLGVQTGPVTLANADWSQNGPMFSAEALQIGVDLMALIGGEVKITEVDAEAPKILLERNASGEVNWDLFGAGASAAGMPTRAEASAEAAAGGITLDKLTVRDAQIRYIDARAGSEQRLEGLEMTLSLPEITGPAEIALKLALPGGTITGEGRVEQAGVFLDGGSSALTLAFEAPGGRASFAGQGSLVPEADGTLDLSVSDATRLMAVLGDAASLPGALNGDLGFKGRVVLDGDGTVTLSDGTLRGAGNQAAVAAVITPGAVTRVTGSLAAQSLDLTAFTGGGGGGGGSGSGSAGWSSDPIDASVLGLVEGEVTLTAGAVKLGVTQLDGLEARIAIENARAVTEIRKLSVFGGSVTGQLVANNRNGLSVAGDLVARGVALQRMLSDLAGIDRFTGSADAAVNVLASGTSVAAWMSSLSGAGSLSTGRGEILGIDLDKLFRSGDASGGTTIFDATSASFSIERGVLTNRDLKMTLASITAEGEGTVDIGGRSLDYLFTPVALKDAQGRGIAIPVRIRGPWSKPQILPDLEKAIQLNADIDKGQIEDAAKDSLRNGIGNALGIEQQEGESDEDALKRGLENQLKNFFNR